MATLLTLAAAEGQLRVVVAAAAAIVAAAVRVRQRAVALAATPAATPATASATTLHPHLFCCNKTATQFQRLAQN